MSMLRVLLLITAAMMAVASGQARAEIRVIASIKPVHSLVASVMEGAGEPALIVDGAGSPHAYSLRPSQARDLQEADLIFWTGPDLETFLAKPIATIGSKATVVELADAHGITKLALREDGFFDEHGHEDEDGDVGHGSDEHGHEDEHDHADEHGTKAAGADDHDHGHGHAEEVEAADSRDHGEHGEFNAHLWLDPQNAKAMVQEIAEALIEADPDNAPRYQANAEKAMERLDGLTDEVATALKPVSDKPFIVFHDAYQNFEDRFGVSAVGSITVSPEVVPGAERISEIRDKLRDAEAVCVFSEPQFEPRIIDVVTERTDANSGVLDPLGASIANGPDLYFTLIRNMADSIRSCLSKES